MSWISSPQGTPASHLPARSLHNLYLFWYRRVGDCAEAEPGFCLSSAAQLWALGRGHCRLPSSPY